MPRVARRRSKTETPLSGAALLAETQAGYERAVPSNILAAEVLEQAPALAHEYEQPPATGMVVTVNLEVLAQLGDSPGEQADLHFNRAGIRLVYATLLDDGTFSFAIQLLRCLRAETGNLGSCTPSRTPSPQVKVSRSSSGRVYHPCFPCLLGAFARLGEGDPGAGYRHIFLPLALRHTQIPRRCDWNGARERPIYLDSREKRRII